MQYFDAAVQAYRRELFYRILKRVSRKMRGESSTIAAAVRLCERPRFVWRMRGIGPLCSVRAVPPRAPDHVAISHACPEAAKLSGLDLRARSSSFISNHRQPARRRAKRRTIDTRSASQRELN